MMIITDTLLRLQIYIVSISILFTILVKIIVDKDNDNLHNRIFTAIVCSTICVLIIEGAGWALDGKGGQYFHIIITINHMLLLILVLVPGALWAIYTDYFIYRRIKRIKRLAIFFGVVLIYYVFLSVTAPFNHLLFYIDSSNKYNRGCWFWQSQCMYYAFFIYVITILIKDRKNIPRHAFIPMMMFQIFPLVGIMLQMAFYGLSSAWSSISISILIVYIYIQTQKSSLDYLTGLFNRRELDFYLDKMIKHNKNRRKLLLLMIDVDKFKEINDTWGHEMGDRALKHCALILKKSFRRKDFIARYGGDEFVVVVELNSDEKAYTVIEKLKHNAEIMSNIDDTPYKLSLSVGYGLIPDDGHDVEKVLRIADKRMYTEKWHKLKKWL